MEENTVQLIFNKEQVRVMIHILLESYECEQNPTQENLIRDLLDLFSTADMYLNSED